MSAITEDSDKFMPEITFLSCNRKTGKNHPTSIEAIKVYSQNKIYNKVEARFLPAVMMRHRSVSEHVRNLKIFLKKICCIGREKEETPSCLL